MAAAVCGLRGLRGGLGEDGLDDGAVDIGEAEVAALGAEGEALVVEAEAVEEGGLDIVDVDGVLDDIVAEFVGGAVDGAGLNAAAGHPHGEGFGVVVAAAGAAEGGVAFDHGGAAEFAAPDDEGFVEEAALFEVGDEGGAGAVGGAAEFAVVAGDVAVGVPAFVEDIDEADAAFDHAAGEEAAAGEGGFIGFAAVEVEGGLGFAAEVHQFWGGGLEAEGEFVVGEAGFDFGVAGGGEAAAVEGGDEVDGVALELAVDAWGVGEVEDGVALVAEADAGVGGGEEAAGPEGGAAADAAAGAEDDEGGEVGGGAAEAVGDPGADAGAAGDGEAGLEEGLGGGVVELVGVDGADKADIVGDGGEPGEGFGEFHAGLSMGGEFELGAHHGGIGADEGEALAVSDGWGQGFAVHAGEGGLGVKEVEMAGGAGHEEVDDGFGLAAEGAWLGVEGVEGIEGGGGGIGEEAGEGDFAEADAAVAEEVAAVDVEGRGAVHGGISLW